MLIDLDDVTLAYDLAGPPDGPVLVLSHCFAANRRFWQPMLPALADYRVLRYDVRGHGESQVTPPPYSLDMLGDDAVRLLDALGIDKAIFCGISMSGMIGQNLGLRHPDRFDALILVCTTSAYTDEDRQGWPKRIDTVKREGVAALREALLNRWFTPASVAGNSPAVRYMDDAYLAFSPVAFEGAAEAIRNVAYTDLLHTIPLPTLVVAGAEDTATPVWMANQLAERIPNAELAIIEAAGHLAPIERPDEFIIILKSYLTDSIHLYS